MSVVHQPICCLSPIYFFLGGGRGGGGGNNTGVDQPGHLQSDQPLCYSLSGEYSSQACSMQNSIFLVSL